MKIEDYIAKHAKERPDRVAVIDSVGKHSYAEFYEALLHRKDELRSKKETIFLFRMSQSYDSLLNYFASHIAGRVAVPLEKNFPEQPFNELSHKLRKSEFSQDIADILFTTGTTGTSKGVMVSHRAIMAEAENLIEAQGYTSELTFVISGPLNHIGSLSKLYPSFVVGATVHILDGLVDMNLFFDVVERAETKVSTFQVPSSLRMLMALGEKRLRANSDKIEFIETGAAPISEKDMQKLCSMLPHTRLYNTYASTETGIVTTHNFNEGVRSTGCVGKPMKNSHIKISDDGFVVCGGLTLMNGYWNDEQMTRNVMREGSIYTCDMGFVDECGLLHIQGRADDVINVGGYKVAPTEIENEVLCIQGIKDCACIATPHPMLGDCLKLLVVTYDEQCPSFKDIVAELRLRLDSYKIPQSYQYVDHIERTYNGKINRKAYQ